MSATSFRNATWTWVFWIVVLVAGTVYVAGGRFPVPLPFLNEQSLFVASVEIALAFVFLGWPLLLPSSLRESQGARDEILNVLMQILVMLLFAMPVLLTAQALSGVPAGAFMSAFGLVLGSAALVGAIHLLGRSFRRDIRPHYYFALFLSQSALPYLGYLVLEFAHQDAWGLVRFFSPFVSVMGVHGDSLALGQGAAYCILAIALGVAVHVRNRSPEVNKQAQPGR